MIFCRLSLLGLVAGCAGLCVSAAHAQLRITEVMSSSGSGGTPDWFEVTNYGNVSISLDENWRIDDSSFSYANGVAPLGITSIGGNESVIFVLQDGEGVADAFRAFWGLDAGVQIGEFDDAATGLSSGSDGVVVFDSLGAEATLRVSFGAATSGRSFYWTYSDDAGTPIAGSVGGVLSQAGVFGAYSVTAGSATNTASPGIARPLVTPTNLQWIGGNGNWTASGGTNWQGGEWNGSKTAVFSQPAGTITVQDDVTALGLDFRDGGFVLSGPGKIATGEVSVLGEGVATVNAVLTGTQGLNKFGTGTLVLSGTNTYAGTTSVAQGTVRMAQAHLTPDTSLVSVARGATYDLNGFDDTVAGLAGLGTVTMGAGDLTVAVAEGQVAEFNGFLGGAGDFVVDGPGRQILATTAQTEGDGAVKNYTGRTIVRGGVLQVSEFGAPIATSEVSLEGGSLVLASNNGYYILGAAGDTPVVLRGGAIEQQAGEDVILENGLTVESASTVRVHEELEGSDAVFEVNGAINGSGALTVQGGGRLQWNALNGAGNYSGTVTVQSSHLRIGGALTAATVVLEDGGKLSGRGELARVGGNGLISPGSRPADGEGFVSGAGFLTAGVVEPNQGIDFAFEIGATAPNFASPLESGNDLLRLTGGSALGGGLDDGNEVAIYFNLTGISAGQEFLGGFFLDENSDFAGLVDQGAFVFYILGDGLGEDQFFEGQGYYNLAVLAPELGFEISTLARQADFGGGVIDGRIMNLTAVAVPEPGSVALVAAGVFIAFLAGRKARLTMKS